ncbi:MAG: YqgE/AlgH family protein [Bradymonadia bacterium]
MSFSTAPGILIAVPQLTDPNFHRSVVVMIEHNHEGAVGLVINQPTQHRNAEITRNLDLHWPGAPDARLLKGGPVEPHSLWILHEDGWCFEETVQVCSGVAVSRSREALHRMCRAEEECMLLVVGYAGWSPGQLENEIAQGAWITSEASTDLVFQWPREDLWRRSLGIMGIDPAHLVEGGRVLN